MERGDQFFDNDCALWFWICRPPKGVQWNGGIQFRDNNRQCLFGFGGFGFEKQTERSEQQSPVLGFGGFRFEEPLHLKVLVLSTSAASGGFVLCDSRSTKLFLSRCQVTSRQNGSVFSSFIGRACFHLCSVAGSVLQCFVIFKAEWVISFRVNIQVCGGGSKNLPAKINLTRH